MLPVHFAPLQGFTESAYRQAHYLSAPGIDTYYTPFLRIEKGEIRTKDLRDLDADTCFSTAIDRRKPYHLVPQIIVRNESEFDTLTETITARGFCEIDINMGCPFPMQTKSGRGAGILPNIEQVRRILVKITQFQSSASPIQFSIKMRLGLEHPDECLKLLPYLNETPLTHITLHPRLGTQQYKGALDFSTFDYFYDECRHPLLFNGDLTTPSQIEYIEKRYPNLAGIMIGRGLLANPVLAAQYAGIPCETTMKTLIKIHTDILADYSQRLQGNAQILDKIRAFWTYAELPKKIKKKIEKSRNLDEYLEAVAELA